MMAGAAQLEGISFNDAKTVEDFQKTIKDYAAAHPDKKWIQGMGWVYSIFKNNLPDKKLVDEVVPDRPVYLAAYDGHTALANSKALQAAGITRKTPDPPSGIIVRDPTTGEPTGVLKEAAGAIGGQGDSSIDSRGRTGSPYESHPLRQFAGFNPPDQRRRGRGACRFV